MTDKFSILASIASDWWWEMDAGLRFTYISERFTELFGVPASAVVGRARTELERTDYAGTGWQAHLDDLANRRPFRDFETTFVDIQGDSHPVKIGGMPLFGPDGAFQGYIGVGHDLTELRRQEQQALRKARDLESILENIDQGIVLLDGKRRIVAHNRRLREWFGIPDGAAYGTDYDEVVRRLAERGEYAPQDKEAAIAQRIALVGDRRFEAERTRRDGRVLAVVYNPLPEGGGVMTYTDVTEARRREQRLMLSEENFRQLFRNLPLSQWVYSRRTLRFLEVNDVALAQYGYTREEFLAMTLEDIRPPEEIARLHEWLKPERIALSHTVEWRHRTKDGRLFDAEVYVREIEFEGEPARIALVVDITARKEAQRLNQRLFETAQDLIYITDGYGRLQLVSPSVVRILGWRPDEMTGRLGTDFIHLDDLEATREEMRMARRGREVRNFRCRYRHKDGHVVSLDWMGVWSEADRRHYFAGRDMTELDRAEAELRQAQKMEAVGQLTGGIAHDFNNILMIILANIEALAEDARLPAGLLRQIDGIERATQRAADLTRQMLAFSRRQPLRPMRTGVNDLVEATVRLMRRTLGETVELETVLAADLWSVEVDRTQLQSALVNVCINARDAMPGGGKLLIETANVVLDDDYARRNADATAGEHVSVTVTDCGTGIAPANLDKVFEPFFTTKDVGKGSGLGLSMVYGFVRQSNGHVKIYSELGHGTAVRIYLPRNSGGRAEEQAPESLPIRRGSERVLVVEDDPQVRDSVEAQLSGLGYEVATAPDGAAALALLEAAPRPFRLILTDVVMPGPLNGRALVDEVVKRWQGIRFVFMSGYTEDAIVHHGRLDAGVLLLNKPFRRHELARIVRQALDGQPPPRG